MSDEAPAAGRCLCGSVRFTVRGPFGPLRFCYCSRCRRATGSAFSANARVAASGFTWVAGRELVTEYEMSPGVFRAFCSRCGTPIRVRIAAEPDSVRVRLGALAGHDPDLEAVAHVHVASKAPWFEIAGGLPQFAEAAPEA